MRLGLRITTVFSTLCYKKHSWLRILFAGWVPICCLILALGLHTPAVQAQPVASEFVQLVAERGDDNGLYLSSQLRFELSPAVQETLQRGIAVFFVAEADLYRNRWYWYDKKLAGVVRQWRLAYQPLTRRWRLTISTTNGGSPSAALTQNFESLAEALSAVQRTVRWKIADMSGLDPDAEYNLDYRFRLDVSQLPRPFQIGAVGLDDWDVRLERVQRVGMAAKEAASTPAREPPK
jgi:Domain of unknown function (DUF4390)